MGAVLVWIAQHAKQLAAWAAFGLAVAALILAVDRSGIVDSIGDGFSSAVIEFETGVTRFVESVTDVVTALQGVSDYGETGFVPAVWYCLDVSTLLFCVGLIVSSFAALMAFIGLLFGAAVSIGAAVWVYRKAVALARSLSNGDIGF